jgi:glycosyltransferase involved in cell wall biosynthesis
MQTLHAGKVMPIAPFHFTTLGFSMIEEMLSRPQSQRSQLTVKCSTGKPRKILLICPAGLLHHGGMSRIMANLTEEWNQDPDSPAYTLIDPRGTGHVCWCPFFLLAALLRIGWLSLLGKVRLIHINVSERGSVARKAMIVTLAHWLNVPIVIHLHGGEFIEFFESIPSLLKSLIRRMFLAASCTIVLGEKWRAYLIERLALDPQRVIVLPNAVPRHERPSPIRPNQICRIVFLGRITPEKGIDDLLNALSIVNTSETSGMWSLACAGSGNIDKYRMRAEQLGIAKSVTFHGQLNPTAADELLAQADVLVLPSHFEVMPMVILEALSHHLAIVSTAVGCVPEILKHDVSGLIVPSKDPQALATSLSRIVREPDLQKRLREGAASAFEEKFLISSYSKSLLRIYDEYC